MYAVIKTGAHQYRVSKGDVIQVDLLEGKKGDNIKFEQVLFCGDEKSSYKIGAPYVSGASVSATIKSHEKHDKIWVFKYRRRKNHKKSYGHKQPYTVVEIKDILV